MIGTSLRLRKEDSKSMSRGAHKFGKGIVRWLVFALIMVPIFYILSAKDMNFGFKVILFSISGVLVGVFIISAESRIYRENKRSE